MLTQDNHRGSTHSPTAPGSTGALQHGQGPRKGLMHALGPSVGPHRANPGWCYTFTTHHSWPMSSSVCPAWVSKSPQRQVSKRKVSPVPLLFLAPARGSALHQAFAGTWDLVMNEEILKKFPNSEQTSTDWKQLSKNRLTV